MRGEFKPLSEDGWTRILRRVRKLEDEGRQVADRLVAEVNRLNRDLREARHELATAVADNERERRYSKHLANRVSEVFTLLTDDQRAEMRRRDSEREPYWKST